MDLVIDNESIMKWFLKLLIYKMNTIDGAKDSAVGVKRALMK